MLRILWTKLLQITGKVMKMVPSRPPRNGPRSMLTNEHSLASFAINKVDDVPVDEGVQT